MAVFGSAFDDRLQVLATQLLRGQPWDQIAHANVKGSLVKTLKQLHACGVSHGDLSGSNVLITEDSKHIWLLDLDRASLNASDAQNAAICRLSCRRFNPALATAIPDLGFLGVFISQLSIANFAALTSYRKMTGC